jgi:hypothetical protein
VALSDDELFDFDSSRLDDFDEAEARRRLAMPNVSEADRPLEP